MNKSILHHLRIPFSLYLMPVFAFAACQYPFTDIKTLVISFLAIHLFLYPADNGYNSWFERRTGRYASLRNMPPVHPGLLLVSIIFDIIGLLLAMLVSWQFALIIVHLWCCFQSFQRSGYPFKKIRFFCIVYRCCFPGRICIPDVLSRAASLEF